MTITQSRTLDEQIAHENTLIDSWVASDDYNYITDLSDLDGEDGYQDDDYMIGCYPEDDIDYKEEYSDELYDDGDYSME